MLTDVVNHTARQFARAIVMPNLTPPITNVEAAIAYRERIIEVVDPAHGFTPLMVGYLTDDMNPEVIKRGADEERVGMPLLVHGEVTHSDVDIFDREAKFIDDVLGKVVADFPELKVVFEHITTSEAVDFVNAASDNIAATITPHHLAFNRNAIFQGGINPHKYCLPIAKRESHRLALRKAATSGSSKFFLGTDTAPHAVGAKESACGCAGIFNAPYAMESYAKTFEEESALDKLEGFASEHGPRFYGLPLNEDRIVLERKAVTVPERIMLSETDIIPFHAGELLEWEFRRES